MYYQVGNKCLEQSQAENVYFSLVVPHITADGRLIKPEYNGFVWKLNGHVVKADLPQCNPSQNLKDGLEVGWLFFGACSVLYFVSLSKKLFR